MHQTNHLSSRRFFFSLLLSLLLLPLAASAQALTVGDACTTKGETRMTEEGDSILACLKRTPTADETDLIWKNSVAPTCANNQVIIYKNGISTCGTITTRTVSCDIALASPPAPSFGCTASCGADEFVTGGGATWGTVYSDNGRFFRQNGNGYTCEINIDSCSSGSVATGCANAKCHAICAKIQ